VDETKLTVRIDRATLERAKRYARQQGTSLTRLVTSHRRRSCSRCSPGMIALTPSPDHELSPVKAGERPQVAPRDI
jgi:hypothetical protein